MKRSARISICRLGDVGIRGQVVNLSTLSMYKEHWFKLWFISAHEDLPDLDT